MSWTQEQLDSALRANKELKVEEKAQGPAGKALLEAVTVQEKLKGNKKIKNATKTEAHGIKFDSKLELYTWESLTNAGIRFEFQKCYVLQPGFTYRKEKIRPITLTVDFWLPELNVIVDSKGWKNDVAPVKYKMLKWHFYEGRSDLHLSAENPEIHMPKNKKEVDALILLLLTRKL